MMTMQQQLDEQGYVLLEAVHAARSSSTGLRDRIHALFAEEGDAAGGEFLQEEHAHRLANLVDKGEIFQQASSFPKSSRGSATCSAPTAS